ncbi:MAG: hypothetical protein AAGB93_19840 [Planctomycetota bacterium]
MRLVIPNELPPVQAPHALMVNLAPLNQRGAPQWNDAVVVEVGADGTAEAQVSRPGPYRVGFVVWERFEGRAAIHDLPAVEPRTITVDRSSALQRYELLMEANAVDALRSITAQD